MSVSEAETPALPSPQDFINSYLASGNNVEVAERICGCRLLSSYPPAGFYVYALIDPREKSIFYIGKGIGERVLKHEERTRRGVIQNRKKVQKIQEIYAAGLKVEKCILAVSENEETILAMEEYFINKLRYSGLTNIMGGCSVSSPKVRKIAEIFRARIDNFRNAWIAE